MDVDLVRRQFSALQNDWLFAENAGGTQVPDTVIQRVSDFFRFANVQPGDFYPRAVQSEETVQAAHQIIADWLGAASPAQIVLGPSSTALNRLMAIAFRHRWRLGDEIIVTICDHEANINPWVYLENFGLKVKFWNINTETYDLELEALERLLSERTVLVAFPHISNILGTENDVAAITRLAHSAGAWVYVDGVASIPHKTVDVTAWDVDFFVFSTYKTFGPHMAALYGKEEHLLKLERANHFFLPNSIPRKFELGTPNLEGCAAMLGVADYCQKVFGESHASPGLHRAFFTWAMQEISAYEVDLAWQLLDGLAQNKRIRIVGLSHRQQRQRRVPVVAFTVAGMNPENVVQEMAIRHIAIGSGHFYAYRLIDYLGLLPQGGVVRVSLVHYNTAEEVQRFLTTLFEIID